jgi:hypothetical protein
VTCHVMTSCTAEGFHTEQPSKHLSTAGRGFSHIYT